MKYFDLLNKILSEGKFQENKKGTIKYLLNEVLDLSQEDISDILKAKAIAKAKLKDELDLWMRGECSVLEYEKKNIFWWGYCDAELKNTYPTYFIRLPNLIKKINSEKSNSKTYLLYVGETSVETNQLPCISLIQFQINDGKLTMSVYVRSSDSTVGLPSDIYQLSLIADMIDVPLDKICLFFGNVHIYENNIEATKQLLTGDRNVKFTLNV